MRTIIIGIGNPVRSDDAVGLVVASVLHHHLSHEPEIDVTELWAGGLRLVEAMVGYDRAIVVDAMATGEQAPGTVRRLTMNDLGGAQNLTCAHDTSLPTALQIWRASGVPVPEDITIWGIEGKDFLTLSEQLTPSVAAAVPVVTSAILDDLNLRQRKAA
jgi:hydrogenase maturation protease